jgi:hypothetical protein
MDEETARREQMWATYGQPKTTDAASALEALGITDAMPSQVHAFVYRDREAAEAYAAANLEHHGVSMLGTYELDTGEVVGVLDFRPQIAGLEALAMQRRGLIAATRPNRPQHAEGPEHTLVDECSDGRRFRLTMRQVGWIGQSGDFYSLDENPVPTEPGSFSPLWFVAHTDKIEAAD